MVQNIIASAPNNIMSGVMSNIFPQSLDLRSIPGLSLWFDATDLSTLTFNTNTISQWNDKSGKGNHVTQATAINQPIYRASGINGRPSLEGRWDGTNASYMAVADNATLDYSAFTAVGVIQRVGDTGAAETIANKYTTTGNQREHRMFVANTDGAATSVSPGGDTTNIASPVVSPTLGLAINYIISSSFSGGTTSARVGNGLPQTSTVAATVFNGTGPFALFSNATTMLEPFAGKLGEYCFYNRILSASELLEILQYLSDKWAIAI